MDERICLFLNTTEKIYKFSCILHKLGKRNQNNTAFLSPN